MPSILVCVDANGIVTEWNNEAQRCTGLSADDARGQSLERAFPRMSNEMERARKSIQTKTVLSNNRRASIEDNRTRYEDVTVYPLIANGGEGAVIRVDDVTEQIRLEEMMVQSEKMLSVGGAGSRYGA